jgi:opacity protein-like surface antigen
MIKPLLVAAAMTLAATTLSAADVTPPTDKPNVFSFSIGSGQSDIEYRRMFADSRLALIAIAGYDDQKFKSNATVGGTVNFSQHALELGLGIRNNFNAGEQFRPFVQFDVRRTSANNGAGIGICEPSPFWNYNASGGAEYFVGHRVSVEGSAGLRYSRSSSDCSEPATGESFTSKATNFGTFRSAIGINFYF